MKIAQLAVDTGITFKINDVVDQVEQDLPPNYPTPSKGAETRRDVITRIAQCIASGQLYEGQ